MPTDIKIITQEKIVAKSLKKYLQNHPEIEINCSKNSLIHFFTTDDCNDFNTKASIFWGDKVMSEKAFL